MPRAALQATPRGRPDGTGREEPHGAAGGEAIEDTARGIVVQGRRGYGLTSEQCGVLLGEARFQAVQRTAAAERIQHQGQHDRASVPLHRRRPVVIDQADEAQWVGVGRENG